MTRVERPTVLLLGAGLALTVGCLTGCGGPFACNDEEVPGLKVQVRDDTTGDVIFCDLVIWVIAGDYVEKHDRPCSDTPDPLPWPWTRAA